MWRSVFHPATTLDRDGGGSRHRWFDPGWSREGLTRPRSPSSLYIYATRLLECDRRARMISLRLDPASGVATYLQLVQQVRQAIQLGALQQGDQLPTVKDVVATLAINPNTVLKAYRELEHEGLCAGRPGVGTFVTRTMASPPPQVQAKLRSDLERWVNRASDAGLDAETMVGLLRSITNDAGESPASSGFVA